MGTAGLDLCREIGDRRGEAEALDRLGHASMAVRRTDEAMALHWLGGALQAAGRCEEAVDAHARDVEICRE
ncbi:hypothetical protein [Streptomyces sp. NPDC056255]|uniref:hypothetical protein n=1 Tax=Streptomyces sp. NPDC056255 TaxID=3345764 RepID=UPI0035D564BF